MTGPQATKRARANTAGKASDPPAATKPIPTAQEMATLDARMISSLLLQAAGKHPDVNDMLIGAIESVRKSRESRVLDFDGYSSSIWKLINITHRSKSGSKQFDVAFDVAQDIRESIGEILEQSQANANPGTRFNALSVLRKIGKTIFLPATDTLGHEVQKEFQSSNPVVDAMREIVSAMSNDERANVLSNELWSKLQELEGMLDEYHNFQDVMDLLEGKEGEEDEED